MNNVKGLWWRFFLFSKTRQMHKATTRPPRQQAPNPYFATIIYCCEWQFCFVTEMYVPVYPPSVVASVSYCARSSVCQRLASTHFKCYFYLNTQRELGEAAYFCRTRYIYTEISAYTYAGFIFLNAGKNRQPSPFLLPVDCFVYWCFTWASWMCQKKETVGFFFVAPFFILLQSRLQQNTGEHCINISTSVIAGQSGSR